MNSQNVDDAVSSKKTTLSVVIPCYNEELTLEQCVLSVLSIADDELIVELVIVDDGSTDGSLELARSLSMQHPKISVHSNGSNQGKGAALRNGFKHATGDFIAVQDADLEYRPSDLKSLLVPLINDDADVVLGSRFLSTGAHRVLYFWHSVGNKFLTLLSNMFTDLNLTDMETCYKVFKSDIIKNIDIQENRFGFEPEIVAKVAQLKVRIFEIGISYYGRTYEEGKKIGVKDGFRALYCIIKYNAYNAPIPIQFLVYLLIGGSAAIVNLALFLAIYSSTSIVSVATISSFLIAAAFNYWLCISFLFRSGTRWSTKKELQLYILLVVALAGIDFLLTATFMGAGVFAGSAKLTATFIMLVLNFLGRRLVIFPEKKRASWQPQEKKKE